MNLYLNNRRLFCITHNYSSGVDYVYIGTHGDVNAIRAAVYFQFMYETHFDAGGLLYSLEIATLLCMFCGFYHCSESKECATIDMYSEREKLIGSYSELINDTFLCRDDVLMVLKQMYKGQCYCEELYKQKKTRLLSNR